MIVNNIETLNACVSTLGIYAVELKDNRGGGRDAQDGY